MNKKILSFALALILVFSTFSFSISAVEKTIDEANGIITFETESYQALTQKRIYGNINANAVLKLASSTDFKLYDSLTPTAKAIYNAIIEAKAGLNSTPKGKIVVNIPSNGENYSDEYYIESIYYATAAIVDDKPEFYWLLSAPYNVEYNTKTHTMVLNVDISKLVYKTWKDLEREYNSLLNAVEKFNVSGNSRYEIVKNIYTKIGRTAHYSENLTNSTSPANSKVFFPSSALLYPYETVCDGYSKAFKMICDKYSIPCIVVAGYGYSPILLGLLLVGGGHAWNYVQMEDGKWYALDLTWDDDDSGVSYNYFLIGSETADSSGVPFKTSHVAAGDRFQGVSFSYPSLSKKAYVYTPKPIPDNNDPAMIGDVNGDGKITVVDAKWILQNIASLRTFSEVQNTAADVNNDTKVTVIDAKWVLQSVAGLRNI